MVRGLRPANEARSVDRDSYGRPCVPLVVQDLEGIVHGYLLLRSQLGHLGSLCRRHGDLIDVDGDIAHRAGTDQIGVGGLRRIEIEIAGRAGQSQHGQGTLARPQCAFDQAGKSRQGRAWA
jgi:hypothetical protein